MIRRFRYHTTVFIIGLLASIADAQAPGFYSNDASLHYENARQFPETDVLVAQTGKNATMILYSNSNTRMHSGWILFDRSRSTGAPGQRVPTLDNDILGQTEYFGTDQFGTRSEISSTVYVFQDGDGYYHRVPARMEFYMGTQTQTATKLPPVVTMRQGSTHFNGDIVVNGESLTLEMAWRDQRITELEAILSASTKRAVQGSTLRMEVEALKEHVETLQMTLDVFLQTLRY